MKKALLVDTNISALPLYHALKARNIEVCVIGGNANDSLAKSIKNYVTLDYSDLNQLEDFIVKHRFDFIVPGCNDLSYEVCAQVGQNKFYGLDNPQVNSVLNNKQKFKDYALSKNLPVSRVFKQEEEYIFPIIIKPVDSFSGRGISVVRKKQEIDSACLKALAESGAKEYIVEEYLTGQLYSHSAFIQNSTIVKDFIVKESCIASPYAVDTSYVCQQLPISVLNKIRASIEFIVRDLDIVDGLLHTQLIYNGEDFWFIELTRRCPGDLYSLLVEKSTGFDYAKAYISSFVDERIITTYPSTERFILRHTITSPKPMNYHFLSYKIPLEIETWVALAKTGDYLFEAPRSRIGIGFYEVKNIEALKILYKNFIERNIYDIV